MADPVPSNYLYKALHGTETQSLQKSRWQQVNHAGTKNQNLAQWVQNLFEVPPSFLRLQKIFLKLSSIIYHKVSKILCEIEFSKTNP